MVPATFWDDCMKIDFCPKIAILEGSGTPQWRFGGSLGLLCKGCGSVGKTMEQTIDGTRSSGANDIMRISAAKAVDGRSLHRSVQGR